MKKFLRSFLRKRVQGALIVVITFALQQFDAANANEIARSVLVVLQALGAMWGIYGVVDANPGHNGKGTYV